MLIRNNLREFRTSVRKEITLYTTSVLHIRDEKLTRFRRVQIENELWFFRILQEQYSSVRVVV